MTVELGNETYRAAASVITGAERDALYARQVKRRSGFAEYERKTTPATLPGYPAGILPG